MNNELITEDRIDLITKLQMYDPTGEFTNDAWINGFKHVLEWEGCTRQDRDNPYCGQNEENYNNYKAVQQLGMLFSITKAERESSPVLVRQGHSK